MSTKSKQADLQGSLRFAATWTAVNAVLLVLGIGRVAVAGPGAEPRVSLGILSIFGLVVVIGLLRVRVLQRQIRQQSGG